MTTINASCYPLDMDTKPFTSTLPVRPADTEAESDACCEGTPVAPSLGAKRAATLAERLKALADPTRLRMLDLLARQPAPICVCDITSQFDLQQPTISHHLRLLREAGLIAGEKRGVWSYYQVTGAGRACLSAVSALL